MQKLSELVMSSRVLNPPQSIIPVTMANDAGVQGERMHRTMSLYRSGGTPWKVIINKQGKVVFNGFHIDPDKAIEAIRTLAEQ